jgi:hypothetical protein
MSDFPEWDELRRQVSEINRATRARSDGSRPEMTRASAPPKGPTKGLYSQLRRFGVCTCPCHFSGSYLHAGDSICCGNAEVMRDN